MSINSLEFLYNYFRALDKSIKTHPQYVKYHNKNFCFESSTNNDRYSKVIYRFNNEIQKIVFEKQELKNILELVHYNSRKLEEYDNDN